MSLHPEIHRMVAQWRREGCTDEAIAAALEHPYWERVLIGRGVTRQQLDDAYEKFRTDNHHIPRAEIIQEVDPDLERLLREEEEIERAQKAWADFADRLTPAEELFGPIDLEKMEKESEFLKMKHHLEKRHGAVLIGDEDLGMLVMYHKGFHGLARDAGQKAHLPKKKKGKKS